MHWGAVLFLKQTRSVHNRKLWSILDGKVWVKKRKKRSDRATDRRNIWQEYFEPMSAWILSPFCNRATAPFGWLPLALDIRIISKGSEIFPVSKFESHTFIEMFRLASLFRVGVSLIRRSQYVVFWLNGFSECNGYSDRRVRPNRFF